MVSPERALPDSYQSILGAIVDLLETARRTAARSVNTAITAAYWGIGQRIVEYEQGGAWRAEYGEELLARLAKDLTHRVGKGFSRSNLEYMRRFYLAYPAGEISQTLSGKSTAQMPAFPLPWSHYVRLLTIADADARKFYEVEAERGGWSVRQLTRQIDSRFYERVVLSRNKAKVMAKGERATDDELLSPEEEIKDPFVLEFLGLKDEYSESELEEALVRRLEDFLLELGGDFAFVGRQRRLRIGDEWYRVDLLFFHRRLRCLVVIDLKLGRFTHADAGQMHVYLNYAREHWVLPGENPPVGLILCATRNEALARYALEGLPNKVLAAEYRTALPDERTIADELKKTRKLIEARRPRSQPTATDATDDSPA